MPVQTETDENQNADETKREDDEDAKLSYGFPGMSGSGESPFAEEIPDADAEMKRGCENSDEYEGEKERTG